MQTDVLPECERLAPQGLSVREWSFLERYPELAYYVKRNPREAKRLERHYRRMCEFAERYIAPRALEVDRRMLEDPAYVPWDILEKACEYRLFSGLFPGTFGGPGEHLFAMFTTQEILATHCVGIANLLSVNGLAIGAVMSWFDPRSLAHIAKLICENEKRGIPTFVSTCVTEPGAGSDAEDPDEFANSKLATRARRVDGGYRVTGTKVFISNGSLAALHVVVAYADARHRPEDALLMLVPRGAEGLSITRSEKKMGQRVCPASEVVFEDVFVPDDMVCRSGENLEGGPVEAGLANVLGMTRAAVGGFATGVAEGAYRTALRYAREHMFLGEPLERQQWVRVELAELSMRAQMARSTYIGALLAVANVGVLRMIGDLPADMPQWMVRHPAVGKLRDRMMGSSQTEGLFKLLAGRQTAAERDLATAMGDVAKAGCSDLAIENCQRAISLMGKDGLRHEHGAEKLLRDVKLLQIYEGTNQVNRLDYIKRRLNRQFGDGKRTERGA